MSDLMAQQNSGDACRSMPPGQEGSARLFVSLFLLPSANDPIACGPVDDHLDVCMRFSRKRRDGNSASCSIYFESRSLVYGGICA